MVGSISTDGFNGENCKIDIEVLWPNCDDSMQFCICLTRDTWICIPCPDDHRFMFEQQMCIPIENEEDTDNTKTTELC